MSVSTIAAPHHATGYDDVCGQRRCAATRASSSPDLDCDGRKWGNQSTCTQTITVVPFDLNDVVFPADVTVNCENVYKTPR
jgi:hypothetical protein